MEVRPARDVQARARREEAEGRRGELGAAFALEKRIELGLERMQIEHVGRGIGELLVAQAVGAPVGGLLLLGEIDAQKLLAETLQAEPLGEGPDETAGDLAAIDRLAAAARRL